MDNIAVSFIAEGKFENALIPKDLFVELAVRLREEGTMPVYFEKRNVMVEGMVVLAKGTEKGFMLFPISE